MFNLQLSRLQSQSINSIDDVRAAMQEMYLMLGMCGQHIVHDGRMTLENTNTPNDGKADGSTLIIDQWNDGTNRTPGANTGRNESHGLYVRHGTSRFNKEVFFDVPPRVIFRGLANANWVDGNPPTVAVTESDLSLGVLSIRLSNTSTQDPNIRSGDTVLFGRCADGNYYAFDSHLDDKIGSVKFWLGTAGNIPPGWRRLNASGTYNANDRLIKGIDSGYSNMGSTGGATTHGHTLSGATTLNSTGVTVNGTALTADAGGDHAHGGSTGTGTSGNTSPSTTGASDGVHSHPNGDWAGATGSDGAHDHGGATGGTAPGTDTAGDHFHTGTTNVNDALTFNADAGATTVVLDGHVHSFTTGSGGSHSHTVNSHTHTLTNHTGHTHGVGTLSIASSGGHSHTVASHNHSVPALSIAASGTHPHNVPHASGNHSVTDPTHQHSPGTLAVSTVNHESPYLVLAIIERFE